MIEVLVASTILIIGVFATLSLLDRGAQATGSSLKRDRGNALALEVVERATGMRYTRQNNDLVAADAPERLRRALDPRLTAGSTPITTTTAPVGKRVKASTWSLVRSGTRYTISYRACTSSDTVRGTVLQGPLDCERPETDGGGSQPIPGQTSGCALGLGLIGLGRQTPVDPDNPEVNPEDVTVRLQLLGPVANVELCLNGVLSTLGVDRLVAPLCQVLGPTSLASLLGPTVPNLLNGLLGVLASGADLGLCREQDVAHELVDVTSGVAATTHVETRVSWEDPGGGGTKSLQQSAAVRRAGSTSAGAGT